MFADLSNKKHQEEWNTLLLSMMTIQDMSILTYLDTNIYEAIDKFKAYKVEGRKTHLGKIIKSLNSNNGGEFEVLNSFL